jgi:hypothetical protein
LNGRKQQRLPTGPNSEIADSQPKAVKSGENGSGAIDLKFELAKTISNAQTETPKPIG